MALGLQERTQEEGAELARRGKVVPQIVRDAYGNENFELGPDYIIPKPFDPRVIEYVAPTVAQVAMTRVDDIAMWVAEMLRPANQRFLTVCEYKQR